LLLFVALLIALGFEFVNGFHDTANAVATVIYTHSLPANVAVIWSGLLNLTGVLVSSGAVAFGIANALMRGQDGTSGVDWSKATEIGYALLLSPLFGFGVAAILLLLLELVVRNPKLYTAPTGDQPPPWWNRGILILTCTGVSFAHGSKDGHGPDHADPYRHLPTAYALNRAMPASKVEEFRVNSVAAAEVIERQAAGFNILGNPRPAVTNYVSRRQINEGTYSSLAVLVRDITKQVEEYGSLAKVPAEAVSSTRNDMYLASEAIRFLLKDKENNLAQADVAKLNAYKKSLDNSTKFIPRWVKIAARSHSGLAP
jgi:inorganic phosphate transporter, PiT family